MTPLRFPGLAFLSAPFSRDDQLRKDDQHIAAFRSSAHARWTLWLKGRVLCEASVPKARLLSSDECQTLPVCEQVFLGEDAQGAAHFAAALTDSVAHPFDDEQFIELRRLAVRAAPEDTRHLGVARSLLAWHERHRFCANCGAATAAAYAGWRRRCPACGAEHFPRVDPVVIMAIGRGDNLLLGRQPGWPEGMFSCLAGFVEPGETAEDAVIRESAEEAGMGVHTVRYVSSQPWPFPNSLMLGYLAETDTVAPKVDQNELEDARWFTADDVRRMLEGNHPQAMCPPRLAIAHHLIRTWAHEHEALGDLDPTSTSSP